MFSRSVRKYLYGLAIAFVPIAVYFGWMSVEASPLVLGFVVAILNINPKDEEKGATDDLEFEEEDPGDELE